MTILVQTALAEGEGIQVGISVLADYYAPDIRIHPNVSARTYPTEREAAGAALALAILKTGTLEHVLFYLEQWQK